MSLFWPFIGLAWLAAGDRLWAARAAPRHGWLFPHQVSGAVAFLVRDIQQWPSGIFRACCCLGRGGPPLWAILSNQPSDQWPVCNARLRSRQAGRHSGCRLSWHHCCLHVWCLVVIAALVAMAASAIIAGLGPGRITSFHILPTLSSLLLPSAGTFLCGARSQRIRAKFPRHQSLKLPHLLSHIFLAIPLQSPQSPALARSRLGRRRSGVCSPDPSCIHPS